MTDRRHKNARWQLPEAVKDVSTAQLAVLMDIRDELQAINRKLDCPRVFQALRDIHDMGVAARRKRRTKRAK